MSEQTLSPAASKAKAEGAQVIQRASAMPAPTWHRLAMNDVDICIAEGLALTPQVTVEADKQLTGANDAFDKALAHAQEALDARRSGEADDTRAMARAVACDVAPDDLDIPALSACERTALESELRQDIAADFETGLGLAARSWLEQAAGIPGGIARTVLHVPRNEHDQACIRIEGIDGAASTGAVDAVLEPGSHLKLTIALDSPATGSGCVGIELRLFAGAGAQAEVTVTQTLADGWISLNDAGLVLDTDARVSVRHTELGAGESYTGLACDLRGDGAALEIATRYVGAGAQRRDFNYIVRHRGKKTTCNLDATGVLLGSSQKTLRGTIDLVHGCKGSEGTEQETVVLADEHVKNKTIPVILCDEDDVAGNHGATIGHVRPEQLFYLMSRGLSTDAAEALFASAAFEEAAIGAHDERIRAAIERTARAHGITFEEVA